MLILVQSVAPINCSTNRTVKVVGIVKQYSKELCITIQHIEVVTSFNSVINHCLNTIVSTVLHSREKEKSGEVVVNRQPLRATVPNTVAHGFNSKKPKASDPSESSLDALLQENVWEEETLTQQQQSVLQIIQRNGLSSTEGVSMQTILQNAGSLRMSPKDIV